MFAFTGDFGGARNGRTEASAPTGDFDGARNGRTGASDPTFGMRAAGDRFAPAFGVCAGAQEGVILELG